MVFGVRFPETGSVRLSISRFPSSDEGVIAYFLCIIVDLSDRPKSQLMLRVAALACMFDALGVENLAQSQLVTKVVNGLANSTTSRPMTQTLVMFVQRFMGLFEFWEDKNKLSLKLLRMKTLFVVVSSHATAIKISLHMGNIWTQILSPWSRLPLVPERFSFTRMAASLLPFMGSRLRIRETDSCSRPPCFYRQG